MDFENLSTSQVRERLAPVSAHAVDTVTDLMRTAGPGNHLITALVAPTNAAPVSALAWFDILGEGDSALWAGTIADAAAISEVVALGFILSRGVVLLATTSPTGEETVRAWVVAEHALMPLTAEEARTAFAVTGQELRPLTFRTAHPLLAATPA